MIPILNKKIHYNGIGILLYMGRFSKKRHLVKCVFTGSTYSLSYIYTEKQWKEVSDTRQFDLATMSYGCSAFLLTEDEIMSHCVMETI